MTYLSSQYFKLAGWNQFTSISGEDSELFSLSCGQLNDSLCLNALQAHFRIIFSCNTLTFCSNLNQLLSRPARGLPSCHFIHYISYVDSLFEFFTFYYFCFSSLHRQCFTSLLHCFLSNFYFILGIIDLHVVLVSGVQQSDSVIHVCLFFPDSLPIYVITEY